MSTEIYKRIEHLRRLAEDKSTTQAERDNAWAFYHKLVELHPGYKDEETRKDQEVIEKDIRFSKAYHSMLLARIAFFVGCEAYCLSRFGKRIKWLRIIGPKVMVHLCEDLYRDLRKKQSKAIYSFGMGFAWSAVPWVPKDDEPDDRRRKDHRWDMEQLEIMAMGQAAGEKHEVKSPREMLPEHEDPYLDGIRKNES